MLPTSYHTSEKDMIVYVFYTILTPVLNPLIYSLRNKDVTRALKKNVECGICLAGKYKVGNICTVSIPSCYKLEL